MAASNPEVEEFIKSKVLPEYRPLVAAFRELVATDFPELTEEMRNGTEAYYGTPVYRLKRIIATISPTKNGITFAFSKGASFEDKFKLLEGVGNTAKNIRWSNMDEWNAAAMKYYLRQAVAIDKQ